MKTKQDKQREAIINYLNKRINYAHNNEMEDTAQELMECERFILEVFKQQYQHLDVQRTT